MTLTQRDLDDHEATLTGQALLEFRTRRRKIASLRKAPLGDPPADPFPSTFRNVGLIHMRELRAEFAASGLSWDDWLTQRRARTRAVMLLRDMLQRVYGPHGYRLSPTGAVTVKRNGRWEPA